jgi:hypothetical protein
MAVFFQYAEKINFMDNLLVLNIFIAIPNKIKAFHLTDFQLFPPIAVMKLLPTQIFA